jgi:NAD+ synthase
MTTSTLRIPETIDHIVDWLRDYANKAGVHGFVVGVSGGIDSAVVSTLCAKTGLDVTLIEMPIHQSRAQVNRGKKHIEELTKSYRNTSVMELNLTEPYDGFVRLLEQVVDLNSDIDKKFLTLSNTRSRLRMVSLYAIAGLKGALVCGTGNKIEDFGVGFYTKYGDGGVDLSPIADLMKSEVYALGRELGVNSDILNARPTDGLWDDGRTDEDQIGATYDELEWAMRLQEEYGDEPTESHFESDRQKEVWNIYLNRHKANKHKMDPIPICTIPEDLK